MKIKPVVVGKEYSYKWWEDGRWEKIGQSRAVDCGHCIAISFASSRKVWKTASSFNLARQLVKQAIINLKK